VQDDILHRTGEIMNSAVLYARVSSKDQEQEGYSIPAQIKLLHEYASRKEITIVEEFIDVETAKAKRRKRFNEMLDFLSAHPECRNVLVEKTDRLYRNFSDYVKLDELSIAIHLAKEGEIISRDSQSKAKLMHEISLVMAKHFIDNLREEVRKGMREKASQGIYPSRPPLGYVNDVSEGTIVVHPENSVVVKDLFSLYATGDFSLATVRKELFERHGKKYAKGYLHKLLKHRFYAGFFEWEKSEYRGTHETFISPILFEQVQDVLQGHNRPKYRKHQFAFGGLLTCAFDGLTVTAEVKKAKYIYYHCTQCKGKCSLPYMKEELLGRQLGDVLKNIYIPDPVLKDVISTLRSAEGSAVGERRQARSSADQRLTALRGRMDMAYLDKLDGKITPELWSRLQRDWQQEEVRLERVLATLEQPIEPRKLLEAERALELANQAHSLYEMQDCADKGKVLKIVLSNCSTDGITLWPVYRKPFDLIFNRAKTEEWCARRDSNSRPFGSKCI
jgi:site-specific DNA recombinase